MKPCRTHRGSSESTARGMPISTLLAEPPLECSTAELDPLPSFDRGQESFASGHRGNLFRRFILKCPTPLKQFLKNTAQDLRAGETDFAEIYRKSVATPEGDCQFVKWNSAKTKDHPWRKTVGFSVDFRSPLRFFLLRFEDPQTEKEYALVCNHLCIVRFIFQLLIHHAVIMPILYGVFSFTGTHQDFRVFFPSLETFYSVYFALSVSLGLSLAFLLAFSGIFGPLGSWVRRRALSISYIYTFLMVTGYCMPFASLGRSFPTPRKAIKLASEERPAEWHATEPLNASLVNTLLGTERIFVDTTLFSAYLFFSSILWLDLLAPSLVRLTAFLHIWIPSAFASLFVTAYIYSHYVNPSTLVTAICLLYSLSLWSYAGRYATELQHRIVFLNWRNSRERLWKLIEESPQPPNNSSAVDGMMVHLHQMNRMIKQLMLQSGVEGAEGQLEKMGILVNELEDTLRRNSDIYSVELQGGDPFSRNFMELHMRLPPIRVERRNLEGSSDREHMCSTDSKPDFLSYSGNSLAGSPGGCEAHSELSQVDKTLYTVASKNWQDLVDHVGVAWNFDLLEVEEETGHALSLTGFVLLNGVVADWGCPPSRLTNFLLSCEAQHQANPYHNQRHAAMVAHATAWLANTVGALNKCDSVERATLYVAALCHDLGHPGRTNQFFVSSHDPLAIVYNDISCLENLHCCLCFRTLQKEENNVFYYVDNEQFRFVRSKLIEAILATDMKQHFETISRFRLRTSADDFDVAKHVDDRWAVLKMFVKMADISHVALPWDMHFRLSCDIVEEFYQQGDEELRRGMPLSQLCDRSKHNEMPKSQEGFIEFLAKPLVGVLIEGDSTGTIKTEVSEQMERNLLRWKQMVADQVVVPLRPLGPRTQVRTFTASAVRRLAGVESVQAAPTISQSVIKWPETTGRQCGKNSVEVERGVNHTIGSQSVTAIESTDPYPTRRPWGAGFLAKGLTSGKKWTGIAAARPAAPLADTEEVASQRKHRSEGTDTLNWGSLPPGATRKEAGPILFTQDAETTEVMSRENSRRMVCRYNSSSETSYGSDGNTPCGAEANTLES
uniref:Phosphodiesterase n=1 Tax=Toxoplasma gondii COUG TaxID=1074873 RepID=A0A2G8Y435_TOXGO|nr:3'5'-cyclic nucleotide phosphodiesterase domain-containing protein [Toxoplasma gondii COUG]